MGKNYNNKKPLMRMFSGGMDIIHPPEYDPDQIVEVVISTGELVMAKKSKANEYFRFLKTKEGRKYLENARHQNLEYDNNLAEIHARVIAKNKNYKR